MAEPVLELSSFEVRKLLSAKDPDAALLYLYLSAGNPADSASADLGLSESRVALASALLKQLGLWRDMFVRRPVPSEAPVYTDMDLSRELTANPEFPLMVDDAQKRLGRILTNEELKILLSVYRYLGLAPEVISILINYCVHRSMQKNGRLPSIRSVEKEAYRWADSGIDTMEQAAVYVKTQAQTEAGISRIRDLLGLTGRNLTASEEKYIAGWLSWGFGTDVIRLAFDKTCTNTGGLKWAYMNTILKSWHEQGFLTVSEIEAGDRPGRARQKPGKPSGYSVQHHDDAPTDLEKAAIERTLNRRRT